MLSERKKHSIQEYLVDRNAAGAAVRSGYLRRGARQTGHRLLTVDDIATQIQKRAQVVAEKLEVDLETVIAWFMDVVEMAKAKDDARTIVAVAKGFAKVCGYYPVTRGMRALSAESWLSWPKTWT